jgi:hypothetical protein
MLVECLVHMLAVCIVVYGIFHFRCFKSQFYNTFMKQYIF